MKMDEYLAKPAYEHRECASVLPTIRAPPNRPYFISENAVGVLPVTCRKACEKAGTLA